MHSIDEQVEELMRSGPLAMDSETRRKTDNEDSELVVDEDCNHDSDHDDARGDHDHDDEDGDGDHNDGDGDKGDDDHDDEGDDNSNSDEGDDNSLNPRAELVPDALGSAVEQIRRGWDALDRHFVCGYLALSEKLLEARNLYNTRHNKGRGKKGNANQAPTPDFATYMAAQLGRDASHINKIIRLSKLDLASRQMIQDRPQLGHDFSVLHALATAKTPENRSEAIAAFDKGGADGRKRLMTVLKPLRARQSDPAPKPSSPLGDQAPACETPEPETPDPAPANAAPETPTDVDADPIAATPPPCQQARDLPQAVQAFAVAYMDLLGLLPDVHVQRVRVAMKKMIDALDRDQGQAMLDQAVAVAVEALRMEAAGAEKLSGILASLPDDEAVQGARKSLCADRDKGVSLSPKWLQAAEAKIAKVKASAQGA